jgi:hypothetical protein
MCTLITKFCMMDVLNLLPFIGHVINNQSDHRKNNYK